MRRAHLHAFGGNTPLGRVEIKLVPLRFNEFGGSDEGQCDQVQRATGVRAALIDVHSTQQIRQIPSIQARMVALPAAFQDIGGAVFTSWATDRVLPQNQPAFGKKMPPRCPQMSWL